MCLPFWHKWGPITGDYQFCTKCGIRDRVPCQHNWTTISVINGPGQQNYDRSSGTVYHQQCKLCGMIHDVEIKYLRAQLAYSA